MPSEWENNLSSSSSAKVSSSSASSLSASSSTATSPEPNANGNNTSNNDSAKNGHGKDCALKSTMSYDPTPYVARARVTRPTPPKPSCNPMQFVQIKPCNLYQSAQQQLKKAEEIKKVKEVRKEDPEDWQNNLDNWKSSRRKRVEHIIDRVVEVKKLEQEEHDRTRRKSKTFSEMMEERGERSRGRSKLQSLASYNEDEANDFSDLGIGTSSASGKSSISEDCEVHSIVSEPAEVDNISSFNIESNSCPPCHDDRNRERISSPGYETSSTAPVASPDTHEYTYEGAIEDYKSRVSKATASSIYKKPAPNDSSITRSLIFERRQTSLDSDNDAESNVATVKKEDLPKIDISKKRELFEKPDMTKSLTVSSSSGATTQNNDQTDKKRITSEFANVRSIKDRLSSLEKKPEHVDESTTGILSGEIASVKERLQCLEQQKQQNSVNPKPNTNKVVAEVVAVPPLKDRLSSLQNAVTKEEVHKKPVVLVDEYQLEMLKNEEMARRQLDTIKDDSIVEKASSDDSGINTTDEKIDHDPTTTEDEDDVVEGRTQLAPEEKLKNLNTPTVVSLVDKPVVVDVGGGNKRTLLNSSKVVPSAEDDHVNHAQNLLKMFKMAFDSNDDDDDKGGSGIPAAGISDREVSVVGIENKQETIVPWRKKAESTESVVKASRIPKGSPLPRDAETVSKVVPVQVSAMVDEGAKKTSAQVSKIPQSVSSVTKTPSNSDQIDTTSQKASDIIQAFRKQIENEPKGSVIIPVHSPRPQKRFISTPSVEIESAQEPKNIPVNTPKSFKSSESDLNLILNIDNSQKALEKKSLIPVASKNQPASPKIEIPSSPVPLGGSPTSQKSSMPSPSVTAPISPSSPSPAARSPQKSPNPSPIYENISFESDISRPSSAVGLRKVSSPDMNGRVEVFNSKSMPPKPKSPEVLPRTVKSFPVDAFKPEVQSKEFQQSARDDFFKDLVAWQPKIVGEQPKQNTEEEVVPQVQESITKSSEQPINASVSPQSTEETPNPKTLDSMEAQKSPTQQMKGSLPFDSCVDILKSFLDAERSYPTPEIVSQKKTNSPGTSDAFLRQETVHEVPCTKIDVKDLPDPNFIRTPCIDVDCGEKITRDSMKTPEVPVRDSISSAGDSSPSSEITVIFKPNSPPTPGSPTPNKSSLMQIANRVGSPIAARRTPQSPPKFPVDEKPCLKLDVKDLPDPNFIRTPCIEVKREALNECTSSRPTSPIPPSSPILLRKTNAEVLRQVCDEVSNSPPLSPTLESPSAEKPNFLIARVEVVETKIKVTTTNDSESPPPIPTTAPPQALPGSPKAKPKFPITSKPKNIFEFLKKNFQSKSDSTEPSTSNEFEPISVDNSKFYVPSSTTDVATAPVPVPVPIPPANNGVNIEITKTITTDAIVEQTDSDLTSEINEMLDEEISKLVVEDAKL